MSLSETSRLLQNILDKQVTDAEFLREINNSRLLHQCKTIGFPSLEDSGLIKRNIKRSPAQVVEEAQKLLSRGIPFEKVAERLDRRPRTLKDLIRKFSNN